MWLHITVEGADEEAVTAAMQNLLNSENCNHLTLRDAAEQIHSLKAARNEGSGLLFNFA